MARMFSLLLFMFCTTPVFSQLTQSIRGNVTDEASTSPVPFATVIILDSDPVVGSTTDSLGNFVIQNVPVGRYNLQAKSLGYEPSNVYEITVSSAKQTFISIKMTESLLELDEVVISPNVNKEKPLNAMATVSAKMLNVEEANRYAGGFDDPARLASSIAGVASNTSENGIIVRGNARANAFKDLKLFL